MLKFFQELELLLKKIIEGASYKKILLGDFFCKKLALYSHKSSKRGFLLDFRVSLRETACLYGGNDVFMWVFVVENTLFT